jgi:hypothetical protein
VLTQGTGSVSLFALIRHYDEVVTRDTRLQENVSRLTATRFIMLFIAGNRAPFPVRAYMGGFRPSE